MAQPCILALFCGLVAGAVDEVGAAGVLGSERRFASGAWATGCSFTREFEHFAGNRFQPRLCPCRVVPGQWVGLAVAQVCLSMPTRRSFAGYLAYGYNDRAIIALTETFGFTGLVLILAVYVALIVSLLAVYAQTFKGFRG